MVNLFAVVFILFSGSIGQQDQAGVQTPIHTSRSVALAPRADAHMISHRKAWFSHAIGHILGGE